MENVHLSIVPRMFLFSTFSDVVDDAAGDNDTYIISDPKSLSEGILMHHS